MSHAPPVSTHTLWLKRLPAIAFFALAAWFYLRTISYSPPKHVEISDLALQTLDGLPLPSQTTQGKAILLNFWAPWCSPCRAELPWLQRLQLEHPELEVIGIEDDPNEYQNAKVLAARSGISYPLVQTSKSVRSTLGHVVELPTTLYISRSGRVLHTVSGIIPESLMLRYANDAIAADKPD